MRHHSAVLFSVLALAACNRGAPSLDRPDGSFDRGRYRELNVAECARGMRGANASISQAEADRRCGCIIDGLIAASSDDDLRGYHRSGLVPVARMRAATDRCEGGGRGTSVFDPATGRWTDSPGSSGGVDDEPPPPEEPTPSANDITPPATVSSTAPGPARSALPLGRYLSPDDYPAAALRNNEQGTVAFTLAISPEGRVTNCAITQSSGSAALDSTTCRIMRSRARYNPARDARGVAIPGTDRARLTWQLPAD